MPKKRKTSQEAVIRVTRTTFNVLSLLRKKLLKTDRLQASHGMPLSHIQVLSILDRSKMMSVTGISRTLGVAKPNVTSLIDKLIDAGYVERQRGVSDRRVVNVVLLPKGKEKLDSIYATIEDDVFARVGEELLESDVLELEQALLTIETILSDDMLSMNA